MANATESQNDLATFGETEMNTAIAEQHHSFSKPAQQNFALVALNPNSDKSPPTDHGTIPPSWYSFDLTHRRIQNGGWTHQVTERELPSSKDIAGVVCGSSRVRSGSCTGIWLTSGPTC